MEEFMLYCDKIENDESREKFINLLTWVETEFNLTPRFAWNQPMFTQDETFIIGFNVSKAHFSIAIEDEALEVFSDQIAKVGYDRTAKLFKIKWKQDIDFDLLTKIINFKKEEKKGYDKFWK